MYTEHSLEGLVAQVHGPDCAAHFAGDALAAVLALDGLDDELGEGGQLVRGVLERRHTARPQRPPLVETRTKSKPNGSGAGTRRDPTRPRARWVAYLRGLPLTLGRNNTDITNMRVMPMKPDMAMKRGSTDLLPSLPCMSAPGSPPVSDAMMPMAVSLSISPAPEGCKVQSMG